MTFQELKEKYPNRCVAFPPSSPKPNAKDLEELIKTYHCQFPKSFIEFQLKYCHEVPMGDYAFDGFGWANNSLEDMSLKEVLEDFRDLGFPEYLTPFKIDNGDFWCFDTRSTNEEFPVVIWDHNANCVEKDASYQWENFIDWLDNTMFEEF